MRLVDIQPLVQQEIWRRVGHILQEEEYACERHDVVRILVVAIRIELEVLRHLCDSLNPQDAKAPTEEACVEHLREGKHCVCVFVKAAHCHEHVREAQRPSLLEIFEADHRLPVAVDHIDHTLLG